MAVAASQSPSATLTLVWQACDNLRMKDVSQKLILVVRDTLRVTVAMPASADIVNKSLPCSFLLRTSEQPSTLKAALHLSLLDIQQLTLSAAVQNSNTEKCAWHRISIIRPTPSSMQADHCYQLRVQSIENTDGTYTFTAKLVDISFDDPRLEQQITAILQKCLPLAAALFAKLVKALQKSDQTELATQLLQIPEADKWDIVHTLVRHICIQLDPKFLAAYPTTTNQVTLDTHLFALTMLQKYLLQYGFGTARGLFTSACHMLIQGHDMRNKALKELVDQFIHREFKLQHMALTRYMHNLNTEITKARRLSKTSSVEKRQDSH